MSSIKNQTNQINKTQQKLKFFWAKNNPNISKSCLYSFSNMAKNNDGWDSLNYPEKLFQNYGNTR